MPDLTAECLKEIHELALTIAECTKDKTSIYGVAEIWMKKNITPDNETPASCLCKTHEIMEDFFEELIDSVWSPKDFGDNDINAEDIEGYRKQ